MPDSDEKLMCNLCDRPRYTCSVFVFSLWKNNYNYSTTRGNDREFIMVQASGYNGLIHRDKFQGYWQLAQIGSKISQ